jgi:hypothetical protein
MKFVKILIKKWHIKWAKLTWVNPLSIIIGSWGWDNINKSKLEQIKKSNSQSNIILNDEIGGREKSIKKKKNNLVNWVNPSNLRPGSWDGDNPIKRKHNVEGFMTRVMRPR